MTRLEVPNIVNTFATLRFAGDALVPEEITRILRTVPRLQYAKGESYKPGPRSAEVIGKTGVWYFSTDAIVASASLADHVAFLALLLARDPVNPLADPAKFLRLQETMRQQALQAVVTCFWHGPPTVRKPSIPRPILELFRLLPAEVETDFEVD